MSLCPRCKNTLKLPQTFYKNKRQPDGLSVWCKTCTKDAHRWSALSPERKKKRLQSIYRWRKNHPAQLKAGWKRRFDRLSAATGGAFDKHRREYKHRYYFYGELCYCCGDKSEAFDHVVPIALGGSNHPANVRPICHSCNSRKSKLLLNVTFFPKNPYMPGPKHPLP